MASSVERLSAIKQDGALQVNYARMALGAIPDPVQKAAAEQAFLAALSATCNVRLSAAAAGFTHSAFYQRAKKDPGFAREWRLAEERGWEALNGALVAGFLPDSHEDDAWRHNAPPDMPAMTVAQAIQLVFLHEKSARRAIPARRRRDESRWDAYARALTARADAVGAPGGIVLGAPSHPRRPQRPGWLTAAGPSEGAGR